MNRTVTSVAALGAAFMLAAAAACLTAGCKSAEKKTAAEPEARHEAHHGGCLNAIETCAVGHAEVKLDGDVLKVWFVGGENETDKAIRAADKEIALSVTPEGGKPKTLTLRPRPNELAGETVGDCSYFEAQADWLAGLKKLSAAGQVNVKGRQRPLKIEYPEGYDPDEPAPSTGAAGK